MNHFMLFFLLIGFGLSQETTDSIYPAIQDSTTGYIEPPTQDWIKKELQEIKLYLYQLKMDVDRISQQEKEFNGTVYIRKKGLLDFFQSMKPVYPPQTELQDFLYSLPIRFERWLSKNN